MTLFFSFRLKTRLLAAAGIFAAGSLVGSRMELPPASAYLDVLTPAAGVLTEILTPSADSAETSPAGTTPETDAPSADVSEPVPEAVSSPDPAPVPVPDPAPVPVPDPVPDPDPVSDPVPDSAAVVQPPTENVPEPEKTETAPLPESGYGDWMEGIFVPAFPEEPAVPSLPEDSEWMEPLRPSENAEKAPESAPMTGELAALLENIAVFWSNADNKIHLDPDCPDAAVVFAGTVEEAQSVRGDGWCRRCAEHLDGADNTAFYIKGNPYAVPDRIREAYSYSDYRNGIPPEVFGTEAFGTEAFGGN